LRADFVVVMTPPNGHHVDVGLVTRPFGNSQLIHALSENYNSTTILLKTLSLITEKCLQKSTKFGIG
jgi:hypothetical protein